MTQPAIVVTGQPIIASAAEAGEPTMEELAALLPADVVEPVVEPVVEAKPTEETTATEEKPSAEAEVKPEPVPAEADAALDRAKAAAAKAREGSRRYAAMQEQQREAQAAVQRAAREAEQLRQENAAARAEREAYKKDPYKALKDAGMTDRDLAERALRENTPEAVTQRLADELKAEREARQALENRLEQQATQARKAAQIAAAEAKFAQIADDETAYPQLSQLTTPAQLDVVRLALARIEANGHNPGVLNDAQVAEAAEKYLSMMRKAGKTAAAPVPAAKPASTAKPSGKTLTNAQAQTRMVAPAEWDSLSDEQQIAHIAAALPDPT